jgi:hypothetical protein
LSSRLFVALREISVTMKPTQVKKNPWPKDQGFAVNVRLTTKHPLRKGINKTSVSQKWAT